MEGLAQHESFVKASQELAAAKKSYVLALDELSEQIKSWRGNDPVTALYANLFTKQRLVTAKESEDEIKANLFMRVQNKVPPGYKDGGKSDGGIGDLLIWKSLLSLGERQRKDLIFVTGEEKADWFVRAGGQAVYPRPELVDEYRRASGGRTVRLTSLHDLLHEIAAPETLVAEIKAVEATANAAIQMATSTAISATSPAGGESFTLKLGSLNRRGFESSRRIRVDVEQMGDLPRAEEIVKTQVPFAVVTGASEAGLDFDVFADEQQILKLAESVKTIPGARLRFS